MNDIDVAVMKLMGEVTLKDFREARNGFTHSVFGKSIEFDSLARGLFPLLSDRKIHYKGVIGEMAAFLKGPSNVKDFTDQGCNFWNAWGDSEGNLRVDYGNAWIPQLKGIVDSIKKTPYGRRHLLDSWVPENIPKLSLPCCHYAYQWYVTEEGYLEMIWTQRSVDLMIGLPSDIASAAILNILMAKTVGFLPGKIIMNFGDCHIYSNHIEPLHLYVEQSVSNTIETLPRYNIANEATLFNFSPDMLVLENYKHMPAINFKLNT